MPQRLVSSLTAMIAPPICSRRASQDFPAAGLERLFARRCSAETDERHASPSTDGRIQGLIRLQPYSEIERLR